MITYKTPAKINLFLDIISKREDQYHDILSLMVKITLFDDLIVDIAENDKIVLEVNGNAPLGEENICFKAAEVMRKKYNISSGISIKLNKFIPTEAGLGGGSSNAAYVIKGIDKIFDLGLSDEELIETGASLGSDVPVFITDAPWIIAQGRGEKVRGVYPDFKFSAIVIFPGFGIKTASIYQKWKPSLTHSECWDKIKLCSNSEVNMNFLKKYSYNVFEKIVGDERLSSLKKNLMNFHAQVVGMSGTGSALYAVFSAQDEALQAKESLIPMGYQVFVVESLK
ncbi:MAG: 4-(cytidine 5'-diphospho)-2-C-methyl-D-erythritol kinase [Candidatus Saelkia tenebricola]|nr:4-(cytidine 5'-diphospho)-2-C-methyl-D-erythritol kinase [Candidatus Saelkia tenebricola]